jgi:hypothetical protein
MQIRKKWLNQLQNFLTNILKNIIWHLFAGESHQVVKITVTYCRSQIIRLHSNTGGDIPPSVGEPDP